MKLDLICDVTLAPLLEQLRGLADIELGFLKYNESVASELLRLNSQENEDGFILVHSDCFFHRHSWDQISDTLTAVIEFCRTSVKTVLLANTFNIAHDTGSLTENLGEYANYALNHAEILEQIRELPNVFICDFQKVVARLGIKASYNFSLGVLYQMPYTKKLIEAYAWEIAGTIEVLRRPEKKVIILDCDDTLWSGVLGEDGPENLVCDKSPAGIAYYQLQKFLREKRAAGFLLGLCSKNNESDVRNVFESSRMPLKWVDFTVKKINWNSKPENIGAISEELGLAADSFIYIDDSDFEIEAVKSAFPEISALKFSSAYDSLLELLDCRDFIRKRRTVEDLRKGEQYTIESVRKKMLSESFSLEQYIAGLNIELQLSVNNKRLFPRLAQITEKTNQFNFKKKVFSEQELEAFMARGGLIYSLDVCDRFGSYGTVGLILVEVNNSSALIKNYMLSCRALGRGIERQFFHLVQADLDSRGLKICGVEFEKSERNIPAERFVAEHCREYLNDA